MRHSRVDYDAIAHLYDAQPYRSRQAAPELLAFIGELEAAAPAVLDIGCGAGNQLIATREVVPGARLIGLDRSLGMLRQARRKAPVIAWAQGDGAALPFSGGSFDFVSCQFAFHHFDDKAGMLRAVFEVLRPGGRFVLHNMCPQRSQDWLCYQYFPASRDRDLQDFWAPDAIVEKMAGIGFVGAMAAYREIEFQQDLSAWLETVKRRDTCSQLQAISDRAYRAGVARLARDVTDPSVPVLRRDHLCLVTIRGDAPKRAH